MRTKVLGKAGADEGFRARLLADPKGAIGDELGVNMPAALNVKVHEDDAVTWHLVLPPSSRLREADMRAVHGGQWVGVPGPDGDDAADHNPRSGLNW